MGQIGARTNDPAERIAALLLPLPDDEYSITAVGTFYPWHVFGMYGTYSYEFDDMAIDVLEELREGVKRRTDLGAEMFREILCRADLCEYGTSPRVCFPTREFSAALPDLIDRWQAFSKLQWGDEQ